MRKSRLTGFFSCSRVEEEPSHHQNPLPSKKMAENKRAIISFWILATLHNIYYTTNGKTKKYGNTAVIASLLHTATPVLSIERDMKHQRNKQHISIDSCNISKKVAQLA